MTAVGTIIDAEAARKIFRKAENLIENGKIEEGFLLCITNEYAYYLLRYESIYYRDVKNSSLWNAIKTKLTEYANQSSNLVEKMKNVSASLVGLSQFILADDLEYNIDSKVMESNNSLMTYHYLGNRHYHEKNYEAAITYLMIAAEKNFPPSQYLLGCCYEILEKLILAIHWYQVAMKNKFYACCDLSKCYLLLSSSSSPPYPLSSALSSSSALPSSSALSSSSSALSSSTLSSLPSSPSSSRNLKLARQVYEQGYRDHGCEECLHRFLKSFEELYEKEKTSKHNTYLKEEVEKVCNYIHDVGFRAADRGGEANAMEYWKFVKKFYEKYEQLIDFDREYEIICKAANIFAGRYEMIWANLVLTFLIQRRDCPFHKINENYHNQKIKTFAIEIMNYSFLPFDVAMICSHYLFDFPRFIENLENPFVNEQ